MVSRDFSKIFDEVYGQVKGVNLRSGERRIVDVSGHTVFVGRDEYLDKSGNPVYRVSELFEDGSVGKEHKSNGGLHYAVSECFNKSNSKGGKRK